MLSKTPKGNILVSLNGSFQLKTFKKKRCLVHEIENFERIADNSPTEDSNPCNTALQSLFSRPSRQFTAINENEQIGQKWPSQ